MVRLADPVTKPAYVVPSMADVRAAPRSGLRLVSTFSGAGGSCLGFRLAGFETLWASEFVERAAETYEQNAPDVPLDRRDIRDVEPAEILDATGLDVGEIDVLEGSPPCASFSAAGKGAAGWGVVRSYSEREQRVDDLFWEFARIRDGLRPRVFVAENVAGLARGVSRGYFKEIHRRLAEGGYRVAARLLDAQWLGVPQRRARIIFVGVRDDLGREPAFPRPLPYRYALGEILDLGPDAERVETDPETGERIALDGYAIADAYDRIRPGESSGRYINLVRSPYGGPAPTITAVTNVGAAALTHPSERRKFTLGELRLIASFPADFVLTGTYQRRAERIGRAVPPLMARRIAETLRDEVLA